MIFSQQMKTFIFCTILYVRNLFILLVNFTDLKSISKILKLVFKLLALRR